MRRRGQRGQTLIMFAITMLFLFLSLVALVGDADTLMVRYNQINSEALLGAQTGAGDVFVAGLYQNPRSTRSIPARRERARGSRCTAALRGRTTRSTAR